jgi:hypothetical protein
MKNPMDVLFKFIGARVWEPEIPHSHLFLLPKSGCVFLKSMMTVLATRGQYGLNGS